MKLFFFYFIWGAVGRPILFTKLLNVWKIVEFINANGVSLHPN